MAVQTQLLDALLSKPKINSQDMSKGKQPGQQPAANRTPAFHTHPPTHPPTHTHTHPCREFFDISVTCVTSNYRTFRKDTFSSTKKCCIKIVQYHFQIRKTANKTGRTLKVAVFTKRDPALLGKQFSDISKDRNTVNMPRSFRTAWPWRRNTIVRNVDNYPPNNAASHSKQLAPSVTWLREPQISQRWLCRALHEPSPSCTNSQFTLEI